MTATEALQAYARRLRDLRRANPDAPETGLAPAFQRLLADLLPLFPASNGLVVAPEFNTPGVGRPDIALVRRGVPARAFVELKAPTKPADPTRWRRHDKRQFERFRELACWATCNFTEFRLLERGDSLGAAFVLPERCLRPDCDDARADRLIDEHDTGPFLKLLEMLTTAAGHEPAARDAAHLATLLAHSARLVRSIVKDRLDELRRAGEERHALLQVRREFRDVLYAHPEAGGYSARDFDTLFSAAFAQTLAFGLLLVRESTGRDVDSHSWRRMPEEHPLMRTALRVLSLEEVVGDIGIGFEVMRDTVNSFAPEVLALAPGRRDPILYFYEDFLETFDPQARTRHGVYYTPVEVVRFMCAALDRALRENLNTQGLRDPEVTILDPATGTGTFLLGVAERVRDRTAAEAGPGMAALALRDLAGRMFGFELLVGPYAVAHYRLHHALRESDGEEAGPARLPRLGVYLTDTLAEPGAAAPIGPLGFVSDGIADERRRANEIKEHKPILAIVGNPPYRRLEEGENRTLVGDWLDGLWNDLKEPVREAGQGGQLNTFPELSVAFWRWAIWKLFEAENAPGRGVVCFIANRKFLTGWPYAGLRRMLRQRFDRIEIIDLRGDVRRGGRAGVEADRGVFDIKVGTAIALAIADGSRTDGEPAEIVYRDAWNEGLFSRRSKLDWLVEGSEDGTRPGAIHVQRGNLDDMRPAPFLNGGWVSLDRCFGFSRSGVQTKRDAFVYSPQRGTLLGRLMKFRAMSDRQASEAFSPTAARPWDRAREQPVDKKRIQLASYRPLDRRWLYNHSSFIDRPRPELQSAWGAQNFALYAMPGGTGAGPAVWCHGLLPDYHAFRGRGGYAFPLYDRRPDVGAANVSTALTRRLSAAYGETVGPEDVFDAILCLLSASSYTPRFAEDLEDVFPHVPFPAGYHAFKEARRIGGEIRAVETFSRGPGPDYLTPGLARLATQPRGAVAPGDYADGAVALCANGSGRVEGLPNDIRSFAVSGYRVLPRWLEARAGLPADLGFVRDLRDICGRIAELIDLFGRADIVLEAALRETLTREALGLEAERR